VGNHKSSTFPTWHMPTMYTVSNKICKHHPTSGIKVRGMCCVLFTHNCASVSDIKVGHKVQFVQYLILLFIHGLSYLLRM
jgi:hypothetical protein